MQIELKPIDSLKPYGRNPRKNDSAVDAVARSLTAFGFRQPIVVESESVIVVGHTRYKAALKLGLKHVPVHVAHDLTSEQARAYRLADNQTASIADWDMELLPIELGELKNLNFDLSLLGWEPEELSEIMAPPANPGLCDPDEVPAPPESATTQAGDLWILGEHRLLCGDSAKPEDVDRLLNGASIHLINSDPPYNVAVEPRSNNAIAAGNSSFASGQKMHLQKYDKERGAGGKPTHTRLRAKDRQLANDAVSPEQFDLLLASWFGNMSRVLLPGRGFYIWGGYSNHLNYRRALEQTELYFSQCVVWWKDHRVLGRKDFMSDHEWCYYGWKSGAAHQFFGPNNIGDVWQVKKVSSQQMVHLTEKPVELAARAIAYSSKPGENVLDLFGGSGSTLIACEQQGRRAFLMELDPLYADTILLRWSAFAGKEPVLERTGETFTQRRGAGVPAQKAA